MTRCAVVRADAARAIGSGHVRRCLTLARRLQDAGWDVTFATIESSPALVTDLATQRVEIVSGSPAEEAGELRSRFPAGVDLLIVDHYQRDATLESVCRGWAQYIMVIDDLVDRPHDADLLVDMTLGRTPDAYRDLLPVNAICLTGTRYALLRPEFANRRPEALARRARTRSVDDILISVGASDQSGIMAILLEGLAQSGFTGHVSVIGDTGELGHDYPFDMQVTRQAHDMPDRMIAADLAIGACGVTSWERCCLGLPTVAVITADNQRDIATALSEAGAVDLVPETTAPAVSGAVERLCMDSAAWQQMSKAAAEICDGKGADRVIDTLLPFLDAATTSRQQTRYTEQ